jgi:uncharacterized repeat protein (TIGR03843 family)
VDLGLDHSDALALLASADLEVQGRMPWSSNATFLVDLQRAGHTVAQTIYKPARGERPLWDFPNGLYKREVAAYRLWAHLGWSELIGGGGVPPTIERDGPYGVGSMQLFIPSDFEQHYFNLYEQRPELHEQLQAICVFDLLANNTDRKGGHCLLGHDGHVWAIDNGLCFASPFKLRTVIWEFAGDPLPESLLPAIAELADDPPTSVTELLSDDEEIEALVGRAAELLAEPVFPTDPTGRRYPWPLV